MTRLGGVALSTDPCELFTDNGIQTKAPSRGLRTFVIELAGRGTYLPTQPAVLGGGYSAIVESTLVGREHG